MTLEYHRACGNLGQRPERFASLMLLRRYRNAFAHQATLRQRQGRTQAGDSTSTLIGAILSEQVGSMNEESPWLNSRRVSKELCFHGAQVNLELLSNLFDYLGFFWCPNLIPLNNSLTLS